MSNGFFTSKKGTMSDKLREDDGTKQTSGNPAKGSEKTKSRMFVEHDNSEDFNSEEEMLKNMPEGHTKYVHVVVTTSDGKMVLHDSMVNGCFMVVLSDEVTEEMRNRGVAGDNYLECVAHSVVSTDELGGLLEGMFTLLKQVIGEDPMKNFIAKIAASRAGVMFAPVDGDDDSKGN